MAEPVRIVVIEDEAPIRRFLKAGFSAEAFDWFEADTAQAGIALVAKKNPDVVLLDLGLPDDDGQNALRELRTWTDVPIIVLTARGLEKHKLAAFEAGADDYVTKPFSVAELMARVKAALRRAGKAKLAVEPIFESNGLLIDFERRYVSQNGVEVRLTPTEYRLLQELCKHAGKVLTHKHLLSEIWGPAFEDATHNLRVQMGALRQKIESDPSHPKYIRTETGVGYRFISEADN